MRDSAARDSDPFKAPHFCCLDNQEKLQSKEANVTKGGLGKRERLSTRGELLMSRPIMRAVTKLLAAATLTVASTAHATEIKVIAANAVKEAIVELVSGFEKSSGHKVVLLWGGTTGIAQRVESGEVFDIVLIAAPNIDKLIAQGKLVAGSRTDIAKSGVGVAVRSGLPKPDISTPEALKKAVLAANSVAYSSGPSGYYIADLLKKMGIADQIKDKVKQPPSGVQVG
jgi:molybdate transport system substrate-binding protein